MASAPERDVARGRTRLLGAALMLLVAFAGAAVTFSFLGPVTLAPLGSAPWAARLGVLALTIGFAALVWERERGSRRLEGALVHERLLNASFRDRLDVLEALLEAGDRLNAPLMVDDALRIVLDAAMVLTGAEGGRATVYAGAEGAIVVEDNALPASLHAGADDLISVPLEVGGELLGSVELRLSPHAGARDPAAVGLLEHFGEHAARVVLKARDAAKDRASVAYLRAANQLKARFLSTVSHELRTPLTSVIGYAKTLDVHWDRLPDETRLEFVRSVRQQAQRLGRVVERILEAARVEFQGVTVHEVVHDVRRSVERALRPFPLSDLERVDVALPDAPGEAEVDPFVIEQAIGNLVDNGLRYTGGRVRVSLDLYRSTVALVVSDEGPGIDPAHIDEVLDPLRRLDEIKGGTGLGLHIVRSLVTDHGGRLELASDPGGTRASVTLPRWKGKVTGAPELEVKAG